MSDAETIGTYDARVEDYVGHTGRKAPDPMLLAFIERLPPNGLVLDLGCGPGYSSVIMRDHGLQVDPWITISAVAHRGQAKRAADRALALAASTSRLRGGWAVSRAPSKS